MTPLTAFLLDAATIRIAFRYDPAMVTRMKTIEDAAWNKAGKFWTVPLSRLDTLIARFADPDAYDLAIHPDVFLACDNPKTFAEIRRENDAWANRQGIGLQPQEGGNFGHSGATVDTGKATKLDKLLADNLPAWVIAEQKEKAMKGRGQRWHS